MVQGDMLTDMAWVHVLALLAGWHAWPDLFFGAGMPVYALPLLCACVATLAVGGRVLHSIALQNERKRTPVAAIVWHLSSHVSQALTLSVHPAACLWGQMSAPCATGPDPLSIRLQGQVSADLRPPLVMQQFVDHRGVLYKVCQGLPAFSYPSLTNVLLSGQVCRRPARQCNCPGYTHLMDGLPHHHQWCRAAPARQCQG